MKTKEQMQTFLMNAHAELVEAAREALKIGDLETYASALAMACRIFDQLTASEKVAA
jgi:flagellin-specific chaperone FliS